MLLWVNLISTFKIIRNLMLSPQLTSWITGSCSAHSSAAIWEASGNLAGARHRPMHPGRLCFLAAVPYEAAYRNTNEEVVRGIAPNLLQNGFSQLIFYDMV